MADAWKSYKQVWENHSLISGLNSQTEEYRVAFFLHCIGTEGLKIYNGSQFENKTDRRILQKVLEKFDEYTLGQTNEIYERYVFNRRNQEEQESIDAYVTVLRNLTKSCNFCDCMRDSLIRDRIVLGVNNNAIRKKLLQVRGLMLKVPLTPKIFFLLKKSTSFPDFICEKIISIDKILAFLQAFEHATSMFTTVQSGIWVRLLHSYVTSGTKLKHSRDF